MVVESKIICDVKTTKFEFAFSFHRKTTEQKTAVFFSYLRLWLTNLKVILIKSLRYNKSKP